MVNGAPNRWTISPQAHGLRWSDAAAPQALSGLGPCDPVIYASDRAGPGAKERLVRGLLAGRFGQNRGSAPQPTLGPVSLELTALGQPRLRLNGQPGPAVSFSQAAGCLWAALTYTGQVGVDAALPSEFEAGYPMARAFRPAELDWARPLSGGATAGAAALLWALKEAAVKALGVGFHLLDPLAVEVFSPRPWQGGWRVLVKAGRILPAWARPEAGGWLAIARYY
ncbi:MAG: 4'-phosphopantetheinyl transferase superfamily protein [Deltaproteobacteria bacterium]|nr:4'-phosphopantetheinyl transferase superfamily protein [Deltaproteobacteria bacterium]